MEKKKIDVLHFPAAASIGTSKGSVIAKFAVASLLPELQK